MRIIVAPDPVLKKVAEPVELAELSRLRSTAAKMAKLMYSSQGCGLAAPQVGLSKRIIVVDAEWGQQDAESGEEKAQNPTTFVNPVIKRSWGEKLRCDEGCLSVPGITIPIERYQNVEVEAIDLDGQTFTICAEGFHARVLQHEIDHLDGLTMFEHLDPIQRIDAFRLYEEALLAGAKPGDVSMPGA
ncbi:MAG: peptide deformylase [Actinomycetia bacterium]|nr:peptide deformylase [Actinomycetes bacterium]